MSTLGLNVIQSNHCVITRSRWVRVRRSWRERLFGGRVNFIRVFTGAIAAIFAQQVPMPIDTFVLTMAMSIVLITIHPNRIGISRKPTKIYELVPDPNVYMVNGNLVMHPATYARLVDNLYGSGVNIVDMIAGGVHSTWRAERRGNENQAVN